MTNNIINIPVPSMSDCPFTSFYPQDIQTLRTVILPLPGTGGNPFRRLDECHLCGSTIEPIHAYFYQVFEDSSLYTLGTKIDTNMLASELGYAQHIDGNTIEVPINRARCVLPVHANCSGLSMMDRQQESALSRIAIRPEVQNSVQLSLSDHLTRRHMDKVVITSSYTDVPSLVVCAVAEGNPSSYIISMPSHLACSVDVRDFAWKSNHASGLFQQIHVFEMIWSDNITPRNIHTKIRSWCSQAFVDKEVDIVVYTHRIVMQDATDRLRVVVISKLKDEAYQSKVARFMYSTFFARGVSYPRVLTWAQMFASAVLTDSPFYPNTPGEEQTAVRRRIEEWIQRRDACMHQLIRPVENFLSLCCDPGLKTFNVLYKLSSNAHEYISTTNRFVYGVNSQVADTEDWSYTLNTTGNQIRWWKSTRGDSIHIPCTTDYTAEQMLLLGSTERIMIGKIQLWPPSSPSLPSPHPQSRSSPNST